ncbi:hypothetical protein, partial [Pseudolactococcus piscium]|uniref:hypothetical protein n=1 Tax=Pseudolactococcus piscium TaxID=1364 RepID=UPI000BDF7247
MVTDEQLKELNVLVYGVDYNFKKDGKPFVDVGEGFTREIGNQDFIVLSTSNDEQLGSAMYREPLPNGGYRDVPYSTNDSLGFSGMAVASINKGVVDYGNVTVVAAATNPASPADLQGAVQSIVGNSTQYDVA